MALDAATIVYPSGLAQLVDGSDLKIIKPLTIPDDSTETMKLFVLTQVFHPEEFWRANLIFLLHWRNKSWLSW